MNIDNISKGKSTLLLVLAILIAVIVVVWVILLFNNQTSVQRGVGQAKYHKIMVAAEKNIPLAKEIKVS